MNEQSVSDWNLLQDNTLQNRRLTMLHFTSTNKLRCGLNLLPTRLKTITNQIEQEWTKESYKQRCKKEFITALLSKYLYWFLVMINFGSNWWPFNMYCIIFILCFMCLVNKLLQYNTIQKFENFMCALHILKHMC